jgi:two-component system, LytTR family, response regulator
MKKLTCIIVDDQEVDRLMVTAMVKDYSFFEIIGSFSNPILALEFIKKNKVDVLFLDIDMPELDGLSFRKKALDIPICIFISSFSNHAAESFETNTLDFIVKPIKRERFSLTIEKVKRFISTNEKITLFERNFGAETYSIKEGSVISKISIIDVLYLQANKDYTSVVTAEKKYTVWINIGKLLTEKAFNDFIRIHKSYAVRKEHIKAKTKDAILLSNNIELPLGKTYKENVKL